MSRQTITRRDIVKRHNLEFENSRFAYKVFLVGSDPKYPFADQGRRLRWLRQAERFPTAIGFAAFMNWRQSGMSQFETGLRQLPARKALELRTRILGFDPTWLWTGDKRGLSFDLRQRIEAEEAREIPPKSSRDER